MTEVNTFLLTSSSETESFCRAISGLHLTGIYADPAELTTELKKLSKHGKLPSLLLIDDDLLSASRQCGLPQYVSEMLGIPIITTSTAARDDELHPDDHISMTLPIGNHWLHDYRRAASLTGRLNRIVGIMRRTLEKPGDFYQEELLKNEFDHRVFDAQYLAAKRRFRLMAATVQQTREGIALVTPEGVIEYINRAGEQLLGSSRKQLIGHHINQIKSEKLSATLLHALKKLAISHASWQGSISIEDTVFDLNVTTIRDKKCQVVGYALILNDITEKEALERRFMEVEKLEALGTLAGGIAHDFNNILLALQANVEAIRMLCAPAPEADKYFGRIFKACDRAEQLIQHFLNFSRCVKEPDHAVSMRETIAEVVSLLQPAIPPHIELHTEFTGSTDDFTASPIRIYEVVMNLVKNAIDAIRDKPGTITVRLSEEHLTAANNYGLTQGHYVRLDVMDTGAGMPQEIANRIFEPFFTTKKIGHGAGIGLSIVHNIVKSMNGHIGVKSKPNAGTEFYILLPVATPMPSSPLQLDEHILLVCNDNGNSREQLAANIAATGCRVTTANDADRMVTMFTATPQRYDMIISEKIHLTSQAENLFEKIFAIRNNIPVIFITDYSETLDFNYSVLDKIVMLMRPYDPLVLQQAIRTLFNRRDLPGMLHHNLTACKPE